MHDPAVRTALPVLAVLLLAACGGGGAETDARGGRTFEPARILVEPDGQVLLVGIGRLLGKGYECGGEQKETAEFVAARLQPTGEVTAVSTVPQGAVEWCAEALDEAVLLPDGGFALGGSIGGLPEAEGSADRGFVAARFAGAGELVQTAQVTYPTTQLAGWLLDRDPPLDDEPPEVRGLAVVRGGRLALGKYQTGWPNYTLFEVGRRGQRLGKAVVRTATETVVLSVEANGHGIYVLTEEFPAGQGTDYRYGLYRHRLGGPLAERVEADPGRSRFEVATDFALQQDGKTVVAGELDRGKTRMLFVMRRVASGAVDHTWGQGGMVLQPLGRLGPDDNLYRDSRAAVGVLPNGNVLVVASIRGRAAKVFRLNADGRPDKSFGKNGIVTLSPF